jgi:hypothetical protein
MVEYYFSPFQYELREQFTAEPGTTPGIVKSSSLAKKAGVPAPVITTAVGVLAFLAYTPLLQPGPPARRYDPFTLPMITLGGGLIV